ncbi:unnamed protein product [Meganyctiphanes norvegica]|uniref:Peptidase S1 domain-containing protein n=1 Tax=Meganyctiphanes norvegica TaxID=48144 RepID=A0AAV2PV04_MEGNR
MKTRWSLNVPPSWIPVNRWTSSHQSSSFRRWSIFSILTLWGFLLPLCCLVAPTLSHPFLYQRGNRYAYARNIRPLPCVAKGGDTGVCMFAWDCMKANGTHLGTCIDRFYFGSCCKLDSKKRPIKPGGSTAIDTNEIIDTPSLTVNVKPSIVNKPNEIIEPEVTNTGLVTPDLTGTGLIVEGMDKPGMTGTGLTEEGMGKPDMTEPEMTDEGMDKPDITVPEFTGEVIAKPDSMIGTEFTGEGLDKPGMIEPVEGIDRPDLTGPSDGIKPDMTGPDIDLGKPDMTEPGMVGKPDMTGPGFTSEGTVKPDVTGPEITDKDVIKPDMTGSEITDEDTIKPDLTGPSDGIKPDMTGTDIDLGKPDMTEPGMVGKPDMTGPEITDEGIDKPDMTKPEFTGEGLDKPGMTGTVEGIDRPDLNGPSDGIKPDMTGPDMDLGNPDMTESGMVDNPEMTGPGFTSEGTIKPDVTGPEITDEDVFKPDMTEPEITDEDTIKPDLTVPSDGIKPDMTGTDMDLGKPDMTESGMDGKPDMTGPEITDDEMVKPNMTETEMTDNGMVKANMTEFEITDEVMFKPDITVSEGSGEEIVKPNMTGSEIIGDGISGSEMTTPETSDIGVQVNIINSNVDSVEDFGENVITEPSIGSTGTSQKPYIEESDAIDELDILDSTEFPGSFDIGDNSAQIDVIGESQITGDSAIIFEGSVDGIPDKEDTFEQGQELEGLGSSDESTNKPEESSTESSVFPDIKPASPISPPSTDSPFDEVDKETTLPQSLVTTFSPLKEPSKSDEDKLSTITDDDQNLGITVIPSAGKPATSSSEKTDNEIDIDIELTTFLPDVTDKIEVDKGTIVENNESISIAKPDIETATELPGVPEDSTVLGGLVIPLPGFPGINVIKPVKPLPADGDEDEKEKPVLPISVIPASFGSTAKPEVEDTTEIKQIETKPPIDVEEFTDLIVISTTTESEKPLEPINNITEVSITPTTVEEFTDLIVISTTTESEKPLKPIYNITEVATTPTTKPGVSGTDDSTDWVPIIFPGMPDKPKPTEKPVETSTEIIGTQVTPQVDLEPEEDDLEPSSSTTIATYVEQEMDLLERLNSSKYSEICGRPVYPTKRIVGGSDASFGEFPWQVSLRQWRSVTFLHKCGAALLNENWAVTAAHCVENVQPEQLLLRLGEFDLERADEPYGFTERKVQIIATHPQFDARTFEYDLALLRFYEPVNFQPNIIPICIPQDDYNFISNTGYVSGWGRLYEDGPLPSIMQKVPVPVITNQECEAMYKVAGYVEHIPQIFICAGYEAGLKDSCEGDSGGPMVIQRDGVWNLAGVISWGIGCALPNQPGVYTRISAFREWIEKIIVF